jgi:hypothetical protein
VRLTRRHLQLSLAALWLLDGVLQCQPFMFTRGFSASTLAMSAMGQPALVATPVHWAAALVGFQPVLANAAFALIQLSLGFALLSRRWARVALGASVVWSLSVWTLGEGLGGVASGGSLLAGAPGAALLYAAVAVLAWPTADPTDDQRPSWLSIPAWCALWLAGAGLQLVAPPAGSVAGSLAAARSGSPAWIARIDENLLRLHLPSTAGAALVAVFLVVALWGVVPGWTRSVSVVLGVTVALAAWLLVQGLGDLTSGQATDPNAGPLIVVLALAAASAAPRPRRVPAGADHGAAARTALVVAR